MSNNEMTGTDKIKHHIRNIRVDGNIEINQVDCDEIIETSTQMSEKIISLEAELKNLAKFLNLCDYCKKEFATCDSQTNGLEWGTGKGNDNVVKCVAFEGGRNLYEEINRLKAESKSRYEHKKECEDMEGCH